jgi:acetyl esterase/lipase
VLTTLRASSNATIVSVNYRAGKDAKYPVPIHDVLVGYDWLLNRLSGEHTVKSKFHKVGLCGQLLGGSLATMLSLTECGPASMYPNPTRIVAAALNNPIIDWVVPDREQLEAVSNISLESSDVYDEDGAMKRYIHKRRKLSSWQKFKDSEILSESALMKVRKELFANPNAYFDSFASPIHFLRTPGMDVPHDTTTMTYDPDVHQAPELRRKARILFPPSDSKAVVPHIRLTTGESSLLQTQDQDFIERMRLSAVRRYLKPRRLKLDQYSSMEEYQRSEVDFIRDQAVEKFSFNLLPGAGLWGYGPEEVWRTDLELAGKWLKEVLDE